MSMLNENDVIRFLCTHLKKGGYNILQTRSTIAKGIDVIAEHSKSNECLHIEVKGETSSKENSNRFGKAFDSKQITNHVARAVLTAMKVVSNNRNENVKAAIAFPATTGHKSEVEKVATALSQLGVKVFFVSTKSVTET